MTIGLIGASDAPLERSAYQILRYPLARPCSPEAMISHHLNLYLFVPKGACLISQFMPSPQFPSAMDE